MLPSLETSLERQYRVAILVTKLSSWMWLLAMIRYVNGLVSMTPSFGTIIAIFSAALHVT